MCHPLVVLGSSCNVLKKNYFDYNPNTHWKSLHSGCTDKQMLNATQTNMVGFVLSFGIQWSGLGLQLACLTGLNEAEISVTNVFVLMTFSNSRNEPIPGEHILLKLKRSCGRKDSWRVVKNWIIPFQAPDHGITNWGCLESPPNNGSGIPRVHNLNSMQLCERGC